MKRSVNCSYSVYAEFIILSKSCEDSSGVHHPAEWAQRETVKCCEKSKESSKLLKAGRLHALAQDANKVSVVMLLWQGVSHHSSLEFSIARRK